MPYIYRRLFLIKPPPRTKPHTKMHVRGMTNGLQILPTNTSADVAAKKDVSHKSPVGLVVRYAHKY